MTGRGNSDAKMSAARGSFAGRARPRGVRWVGWVFLVESDVRDLMGSGCFLDGGVARMGYSAHLLLKNVKKTP